MSTTLNRELLLSTLQSVQSGLCQSRETIEQSGCFVFQNGRVITFNEEVCCSARSLLPKSLTGAVTAKKLLELLSKMPQEEIDIDVEGGELRIRGGSRHTGGLPLQAEILLAIGSVENPTEWQELPADFGEALDVVAGCASRDATRFNLTCIHIAPKFVEAMDNTQLIRYQINTGLTEDFLVRREAVKQLSSLGMTEVCVTEHWLHFRNAKKLIFSCRRYLETYPDTSEFLKVSGTPLTLPGGLAEDVGLAAIFSTENGTSPDENKVQIDLRPGKLKIRGDGGSGWVESRQKSKYAGPPLNFFISPNTLTEIVKRSPSCEITTGRLKITGERYKYVSCLMVPETVSKEEEVTDNAEE